jgi:hypothetical protein
MYCPDRDLSSMRGFEHLERSAQFINGHKPDVVVYDVPMPHGSQLGSA